MSLRRRLLQGVCPAALTTRQMLLVGSSALMLGLAMADPASAATVASFSSPVTTLQSFSGSTSLAANSTGLLATTISSGGTLLNSGTLLNVGTTTSPNVTLIGIRGTLVSGGTLVNGPGGTIGAAGTGDIIRGIVATTVNSGGVLSNQGFIGGTFNGGVSAASSVRGISVTSLFTNGTIVNSGTILGNKGAGVTIVGSMAGSTIINTANSLIEFNAPTGGLNPIGIRTGIFASGLIDNQGTIAAVTGGITGITINALGLTASDTVINDSTGRILGLNGPSAVDVGIGAAGNNAGLIDNQGTIAFNSAGGTGIKLGAGNTGVISNEGLISLSPTGSNATQGISVVTLSAGSIVNSVSGTIVITGAGTGIAIGSGGAPGGTVLNQGQISISGGSVASKGILVTGNGSSVVGASILNQGTISVGAGTHGAGIAFAGAGAVTGSIGNSGLITVGAGGSGISVVSSGGTISNSGTIVAGAVGIAVSSIASSSALIDNSQRLSANTGILSNLGAATITNEGVISAGTLGIGAGTLTSGLISNAAGATISVASGGVGISAGPIGAATGLGGLGSAGSIVNAGAILAPGGIGIAIGTLSAATCSSTACSTGVIVNNGLISAQTALSVGSGPLVLTNSGTVSGNIAAAASGVTFIGGSAAAPGTLTGGTINATGVQFASGAQVLNDAINVGGGTVVNSGAALTIKSAQNITGAFSQTGGSLMIGVSGTATGNYGELVVTGAAGLTGSNVTLAALGSFTLAAGETFTIVNAGGGMGALTNDTFFAGTLTATGTVVGDLLEVAISGGGGGGGSAVTLGNLTSVYSNPSTSVVSGAIAVQATSIGSGGSISNSGSIVGTGSNGIALQVGTLGGNGITNSVSGVIAAATGIGVALGNAAGGSLVNSGLISGRTALSIGSGSLNLTNSGIVSGNVLGNGVLTVAGGNAAAPGTLTGGTIHATGVQFASGAQVLNDAINVSGGTVVNSGAALTINGAQNVTGAFSQTGGSLMIGVSGTATGNYGELVVTGAAGLTGSNVTLAALGSFSLAAGETFTIVNAGGGMGALANDTFFAAGLVATGTIVGNDLEIVLSTLTSGSGVTLGNLTSVYSNPSTSVVSGAIAVQATSIGSGGSISNSGSIVGTGSNGIALQVGTLGGNGITNSVSGVIAAATGIGVALGNAAGGSLVNSGLISGRTALSIGSGALNLTNSGVVSGNVLGNGVLTVAGGNAAAPGSLTGGTIHATGVTFASGAQVLNDAINVGSGTVVNSGAALTIKSAQNITGAFSQTAGSLMIGVSGTATGNYGELVVIGAAGLTGSNVTLAALGSFTLAAGETFTIVNANGGMGALANDTFFAGTLTATGTVVGDLLEVAISGGLTTVAGTVLASPFTGSYANTAYMAAGATGIQANILGGPGSAGTISNSGTITGTVAGIAVAAGIKNGTVANSGLISVAAGSGSGTGISSGQIVSISGGTALISNAAGGTIGVAGGAGAIGIGVGTMVTGSIVNSGLISASLTGSSGSLAGILVSTLGGGTLITGTTGNTVIAGAQILNSGTISIAGGNSSPGSLTSQATLGTVTVQVPAAGVGAGIEVNLLAAGSEPAIVNNGLIVAPIGIIVGGGDGSGLTVSNNAGGTILASGGIGINVQANSLPVAVNQGYISAGTGIVAGQVTNSGTISGTRIGVSAQTITNSGLISAGVSGTAVAGMATLTNSASGSIVGMVVGQIGSGADALNISNAGVIAGDIVMTPVQGGPPSLYFNANVGTGLLTGANGSPGHIGAASCATVSGCYVRFNAGSNQILNDDINLGAGGSVENHGVLTVNNQRTVTAGAFYEVNDSGSSGNAQDKGTIVVGVGGTASANYGELVIHGNFGINAGTGIDLVAETGFTFTTGERFTIAAASLIGGLSGASVVNSGLPSLNLSISNGSGTATGFLSLNNSTELLISITSAAGGTASGSVVNIGTLTSVYPVASTSLISGGTAFQVTVLSSSGTISNAGTIQGIASGSVVGTALTVGTLAGGIANSGTISGAGLGIIVGTASGGFITNSGLISGATALSIGSGSLTVTNSGTIAGAIKSGGALAFAGSGGTLSGGGIGAQGVSFVSGNQQLNENISVGGSGTVTNAATLGLAGKQTITGNYAQTAAGAVLGIEVGGDPTKLGTYGELVISGVATLAGGTLALSAETGFHFATGEFVTVVATSLASDLTGSLSSLTFTDGSRTVLGTMGASGGDLIVTVTSVSATVGTQIGSLSSVYSIGTGSTIAGGTGVLVSVIGSGGAVSNAGAVLSTIAGGTGLSVITLAGGGAITNSGVISAKSGIGINVSTLSGAGTLTNSGNITGKTALFIGSGTGVLTLSNSGTIGAIVDKSTGVLTLAGGSAATPGSLTGSINAAGVVIASGAQQLTGNISVGSSHSVVNNGMLMLPVDPTITGNFIQTASSAVLQISAPNSVAGSYGDLVVSGGATLTGGTIVLSAQNNFTFASGETFTIVTAGSPVVASGLAVSLSGAQASGLTDGYVVSGDELLVTIGGGGGTVTSPPAGSPISIASLTTSLNIGSNTVISAATAVQVGVIGGGGALNNSGSLSGLGAGGIAIKVGTLAGGLISNAGFVTAASGIGIQVATPSNGTIINTGLISAKTALSIGGGLVNVVNSGVLSGNIGGTSAIMTISGAGGALEFGTLSVDSVIFAPGAIQKLNGVTDAALVLTNQGVLSAGSGGTVISAPHLAGALTNTGQIAVAGSGAAIVIGSVAGGAITNSGLITAMTAIRVGSGGLSLTNTGTIAGSVIDSDPVQGLTISGQGGTFTGGSISAASVTFASGVQFLAQDIIAGAGAGQVINNATLQLNARHTITGSYVQNAAGTLQIGVASVTPGGYGELVVTGSAAMTNGRISLATVGNYRAPVGSVLTLVSAAATGSSFAGVSAVTLSGYGFNTSTLVAGGIDELLATITSAPGAGAGAGGNPSSVSGGSRIAAVTAALAQISANGNQSFQPVFDALNTIQARGDSAAYARALKQLAPSQISATALAPSVLADLSRQVLSAIGIHTGQALAGADRPRGESGGSPPDAGTMGWVQVLGRATNRKGDGDTDGYSASSYGIAAGVDTPIGRHDNGLAGVALSWGRGNVNGKSDSEGTSTNIDSYQVSGYGRWTPGPVTLDAMAGYGYDQVGQHRPVDFLGQTATANYSARHVTAAGSAGYSIPLDDDLILTPAVSLHYLHVDGDGYTEKGAGVVNLTIAKSSVDVIESGVGGKLSWAVDTDLGRMMPELKVAWVHDYGDGPLATTAQLAGVSFVTSVPRPTQDGVDVGLALTLYDIDGMSFSLRYDGDIRSNYSSNAGNLNVQVPF